MTDGLIRRSGGVCECCGAAGTPDRHHLREYALGGEHTLENLLLLCPSSHRQIPRFLSLEQQRQIQVWHEENLGVGNLSSTAQLRSVEPSIDLGTVRFLNVKHVLRAYGQAIVTVHKEESGYFINLVMLEWFEPKLMVLSNKVIVNDGYSLQTSRDGIVIASNDGETQFTVTGAPDLICAARSRCRASGLFSDEGFRFRGLNLKYVIIDCASRGFVAMDVTDHATELNVGGARVRIPAPQTTETQPSPLTGG